jgi:RNA polymerase-interacting CarD/CdnL/TRCF family regulator
LQGHTDPRRDLQERNKNLEDTVQRLVEERNELRYEMDSIARASKSVIGIGTPDDREDITSREYVRTARELDRSYEEKKMLQSELNKSIDEFSTLSKKYKNIKDKYFRQSLRQNELQNYLVRCSLHISNLYS